MVELPDDAIEAAIEAWFDISTSLEFDRRMRSVIAVVTPLIAARVRAEAEQSLDQALSERDEYHEWADRLAYALGGDGIGEHSSANNPWATALELASERDGRVRAEAVAGGDREALGRAVRAEWVEWAREQPNPKPSWLVPWDELAEPDRPDHPARSVPTGQEASGGAAAE